MKQNIFLTLCIITILCIITYRTCTCGDTQSQIIALVGITITAAMSVLMNQSKRKKVLGGDVQKESKVFQQVKSIYKDFFEPQKLIYEYKQIPDRIKYQPDSKILNINCHLGQRKLLLTEIEFYTKCLTSKNDKALVIYAGSASCEHLPVILDMYPNLKFILVDPNYHSIDKYPMKYVYQNVRSIEKGNLRLFQNHLKSFKGRGAHLNKTTKLLQNIKFMYDDSCDVLDTSDKYFREDESSDMDSVMERFYNNDYKNLVPDIMKSKERVFIVQDYMTEKLSTFISKSMPKKLPIYFLTDIRTNIYDGSSPHDIDIMWNYALQIIFLKILQPVFSMLKFRPPFGDGIYSSETREMKVIMKTSAPEGIKAAVKYDLELVRDKYGLDMFGEYLKGNFKYFANDFIYIQPWGRVATTETRLFVSRDNINKPYIKYDVKEWENRFSYVKFLRMYGFHKKFYNISGIKDYDGCYDCARELQILGNYILNEPTVSHKINNPAIIKVIKKNKAKIKELYELINQYTYFDLSSSNYKCQFHGRIVDIPEFIPVVTLEDKLVKHKLYRDSQEEITVMNIPMGQHKKIRKHDLL